jgi:hypothetical protein
MLGNLYRDIGKIMESKRMYTRYIELEEDEDKKREVQKIIENLK